MKNSNIDTGTKVSHLTYVGDSDVGKRVNFGCGTVTVNYNMYDSNEDLYAKLKSGGVNSDVIIPSDYMAERLKNEGLLQKLDYSDVYKRQPYRDGK